MQVEENSIETSENPTSREKQILQNSRWAEDQNDSDESIVEDRKERRSKKRKKRKSVRECSPDDSRHISEATTGSQMQSNSGHSPIDDINKLPNPTNSSLPIPQSPRLTKSYPTLQGCRLVDCYEKINRIEEGTYGVVYRAREIATGEIVALKKLKLDKETNGFPITTLREIHTLLLSKHPNIVNVREIVVGSTLGSIYIVMDFIEHDIKTLLETMKSPFLQSEVKTIMLQLLSAVKFLHDNWIVHRDLKTSNLLINNKGEIKVADFGLARIYGSPLGPMTQLVVTLWYRAPELLLGAKEYTTAIDMWSIGCIFAELLTQEPLFPGRGEIGQFDKICHLLGVPNENIWPGFSLLPVPQTVTFPDQPYNRLRSEFPFLTESGVNLLSRLLTYDPEKRITAEEAMEHPYFRESPLPKNPSMFPTWPVKSDRRSHSSPNAPKAVHAGIEASEEEFSSIFQNESSEKVFHLRV